MYFVKNTGNIVGIFILINGTECQWNVDVTIYGHPEGIAGVLTARPIKNPVESQHCASNVYNQFC